MNKAPTPKQKNIFLPAVVLGVLILLIILTTRSGATNFLPASERTATPIPPDILTQLALKNISPSPSLSVFEIYGTKVVKLENALTGTVAANPLYDTQKMYPILPDMPEPEQILNSKLKGTLAGYGILSTIEPPVVLHGTDVGMYELNDLSWEEWSYDSFINVWTGRLSENRQQGVVWVQITPHYGGQQGIVVIPNPIQAGNLKISGARQDRLILTSEDERVFYFDVPTLSFVDHLTIGIATPTPVPTDTSIFTGSDDAPDIPSDTHLHYQRNNTDLNFFLNTPEDSDWFLFDSRISGPVTVSLTAPLGTYGLRLVYLDHGAAINLGKDETIGNTEKKIFPCQRTRGTVCRSCVES